MQATIDFNPRIAAAGARALVTLSEITPRDGLNPDSRERYFFANGALVSRFSSRVINACSASAGFLFS